MQVTAILFIIGLNLCLGLIYCRYYLRSLSLNIEKPLQFISILFGFAAAGCSLIVGSLLDHYLLSDSIVYKAFFLSSLVEESFKLVFIIFLFRNNRIDYNLSDGIVYAVFLGLTFGIIENILYFQELEFWSLIFRTVTSLPFHLMTSGILGAYTVMYLNSNKQNYPFVYLWKGLLFTYLLHGFYNYSALALHERMIYIPVILILAFVTLEYLVTKSKVIPPKSILDAINLKFDDYHLRSIFKKQNAWLRMGQGLVKRKEISLFLKISKEKLFYIGILFSITTFFFIIFLAYPLTIYILFPSIQITEYECIFLDYPFFIMVSLLLAGSINPKFFQDRILKVPSVNAVRLENDIFYENSVVFHFSGKFFYTPLNAPELLRGNLSVSFWIYGKEFSKRKGKVVWFNSSEISSTDAGAMVQLEEIPLREILFWYYGRFLQNLKNFFRTFRFVRKRKSRKGD